MNPEDAPRAAGDADVAVDLAAYVLDALDAEARARLEARLREGGDPQLAHLLAEYRAVAELLPYAAAPQAVPPEAWDGVLARVRGARRASPGRLQRWREAARATWRRLAVVQRPALAAAFVALLLWNVQLQRQPVAGPGAPGGAAVGVERLARLPQGPIVPLEGTGRPGASARLFVSGDGREAWLAVAGLPPLSNDRIYQLWFARPGQPTVAGAAFRVDASGEAVAQVTVPAPLGQVTAVAVTEEAAPGSPLPTGQHLLDGRP